MSFGSGSLSFVFRISCSSSVGLSGVALRCVPHLSIALQRYFLGYFCAPFPPLSLFQAHYEAVCASKMKRLLYSLELLLRTGGLWRASMRASVCLGNRLKDLLSYLLTNVVTHLFAPTETQHRRVRHPLRGSQQFDYDYDYDFIGRGRPDATKAQALSARQHRRAPRNAQRRRAPAARDAQLPLPRPRRAPPEPRLRAAPVQVRDRQLVDRAPPLCAAPARGGGARAKGGAEGVRGAEAGVQ